MPASYSVCGLGLQVNVPIAGLGDLPRPTQVDVRVTLGSMPPDLDRIAAQAACEYFTERDEQGQTSMRVSRLMEGRYYRIAYSAGITVVVDSGGDQVWATWTDSSTEEDAAAYLLGSALGFVLRLRGVACLHASAIAVGGRAIALVGPSGTGKSSTAAGFARLGYAVLTDDLAALCEATERIRIQPALPRVHLWPQSAQSMFGSLDSLPRITPNWDKRRLDLAGDTYQREPLPLAAIYFLAERSAGCAAALIDAMSPALALINLVSDSHATEFVERPQRAQEFDVLARLVKNVPSRRVTPSADLTRIPDLCEAIVRDFHGIAAERIPS
jgi:hypothetical protein